MMVRTKVCGITRREDALLAATLGVDAIGLNFYPPSPRYISPDKSREVIDGLPPFINVVALFVNPERHEVEQVLDTVAVHTLQFHGTESPEYCASFSRPYLKAIGVGEDVDLTEQAGRYRGAQAVLLDAFDQTRWGGTGERFDWDRVPDDWGVPFVIAGGLDADNVAEAVERLRPDGVDVCGGVEATKGIKDEAKLRAFMRSVQRVSIG